MKNEDAVYYIDSDQQCIDKALLILTNRMINKPYSFSNPNDVKNYLTIKLAEKESESFDILFMDSQLRLIAHETLFTGTTNGCSVYPREIVKALLKHNAQTVILAHNHPSGIPEPSSADKEITQKIKSALKTIDAAVIDHIIVGGVSTYSFAEHGLI